MPQPLATLPPDSTGPADEPTRHGAIARGSEALIYRHSDECAAILEARRAEAHVGAGCGCSMRSFSELGKLFPTTELSQSAGQQ